MPELGKERGRGRGQRKRPRPGAQLARLEAAASGRADKTTPTGGAVRGGEQSCSACSAWAGVRIE